MTLRSPPLSWPKNCRILNLLLYVFIYIVYDFDSSSAGIYLSSVGV